VCTPRADIRALRGYGRPEGERAIVAYDDASDLAPPRRPPRRVGRGVAFSVLFLVIILIGHRLAHVRGVELGEIHPVDEHTAPIRLQQTAGQRGDGRLA
jgi:hypothetical protein